MALIDKLAGLPGIEGEKFSVNAFHSMLEEMADGAVNKAQIVAYFGMDADDQSDLDWLIARYNAQPVGEARAKFVALVRRLFLLAEERVPGYTTSAQLAARINSL